MSLLLYFILLVGAVFAFYKYHDSYANFSFIITVISIIIIAVLISFPFINMSYRSEVQGFKALQQTIAEQRIKDNTRLERVALTQEIIKGNKWLGRMKYWNGVMLIEVNIPNEVEKLEYIK